MLFLHRGTVLDLDSVCNLSYLVLGCFQYRPSTFVSNTDTVAIIATTTLTNLINIEAHELHALLLDKIVLSHLLLIFRGEARPVKYHRTHHEISTYRCTKSLAPKKFRTSQ